MFLNNKQYREREREIILFTVINNSYINILYTRRKYKKFYLVITDAERETRRGFSLMSKPARSTYILRSTRTYLLL